MVWTFFIKHIGNTFRIEKNRGKPCGDPLQTHKRHAVKQRGWMKNVQRRRRKKKKLKKSGSGLQLPKA